MGNRDLWPGFEQDLALLLQRLLDPTLLDPGLEALDDGVELSPVGED